MADAQETMREMIKVGAEAIMEQSDADPVLQRIAIMWMDCISLYALVKGQKDTELGQLDKELPNA